jgi:hypothetical protein
VTNAVGLESAFVVGTGRCGSTLLSRALASSSRVASVSECIAVLGAHRVLSSEIVSSERFVRIIGEVSPDQRAVLALRASIKELASVSEPSPELDHPLCWLTLPGLSSTPRELLAAVLLELSDETEMPFGAHMDRLFGAIARHTRRERWIERSGGSLSYVDRLLEFWPQAKLVHLFRDGEACAASMSQHPYFRILVSRAMTREPERPISQCLDMAIPLSRFGAYWSSCILHGVTALRSVPRDRVLQVSYSALCRAKERELGRISEFLELESDWVARVAPLVRANTTARPWPTELVRSCRLGHECIASFDAR